MSRLLAASLASAGLLLAAGSVRADVEDQGAGYDPGPALRRSGFATGLFLGGTAGVVSGYPNELEKIDSPSYEASTGLGAGAGGGLWIGGALRDWLVFGVGPTFSSVSGGGYGSSGFGVVLHVEGYPLFPRGGTFRDLGVFAEVGAGGRTVKQGGDTAAQGGAMSLVALGIVYEPLRLGRHISAGPALTVSHQFSPSLEATLATLGLRVAFYGGPG